VTKAKPTDFDILNKSDGLCPVMLPSGGLFYVHEREVAFFNDRCKKYQSDNHFTNVSDLMDLDRLLIAELLIWRWGNWVSQKRDHWGDPIDENAYQKMIREHSGEVRMGKKALGLDKETRDKIRGEDSVDAYIKGLRRRAKEFGYMRNAQAAKAIELWQELASIIILYNNCDKEEREQQHCTPEEIMTWIADIGVPSFNAIDEEFRRTSQKTWINEM
jgi:hypothetical protein